MIFTIISLALIPVIILIIFLLITDRRSKEPTALLFKLFILGGVASIPILIVEIIFQNYNFFVGILNILFESFIVAGFTEEFFKRLVVIKIAFTNVAFDEKLDGIIYSAFVSLGFAAVENILYLTSYFNNIQSVALARAIFSVPGHMLFAIIMGYYISLAKYSKNFENYQKNMSKALLFPIILHGTFNTLLSLETSFLFIFIPYMIFLWIFALKKLNIFYKESKKVFNKKRLPNR